MTLAMVFGNQAFKNAGPLPGGWVGGVGKACASIWFTVTRYIYNVHAGDMEDSEETPGKSEQVGRVIVAEYPFVPFLILCSC